MRAKIDTHWIVKVTITCILTPFILLGNILVITAVVKFRRLQIPTNYFLVQLAIADVGVALLLPVEVIVDAFRQEIQNEYLCLIPDCFLMTVRGVSILSMVAVAVDRNVAISSPMEYVSKVTVERTILFAVIAFFISAVVSFSPLMGWHYSLSSEDMECSYSLAHKNSVILLVCVIFLPAYVLIFYCYFRIFCVARKHVRAIKAMEGSLYKALRLRYIAKDTKYAKTLALVIGLMLLLWLPFQICIILEKFTNCHLPEWLCGYLSLLTILNSGINPWVYAYKTYEFRAAFKQLGKSLQSKFDTNMVQNLDSSGSQGLNNSDSHVNQDNLMHCLDKNKSNVMHHREDLAESNLNNADSRMVLNTLSGHCAMMVANTASIVNFIDQLQGPSTSYAGSSVGTPRTKLFTASDTSACPGHVTGPHETESEM